MSLLIIERGPEKGKRIHLQKFPCSVGRDESCEVVLNDPETSRRHFMIKKRGKLFIVLDLDSSNGLYLNGERVVNAVLSSGDKILIGGTEFRFFSQQTMIRFTDELQDLDIMVAEELGIDGPLTLKGPVAKVKTEFPRRLNKLNPIAEYSDDAAFHQQLFDFISDLQLIFHFEDLCNTVLKQVGTLLPGVSRAVLFSWSATSQTLSPKALRHFEKNRGPFLLNKKSFEDAVYRKQGVIIPPGNESKSVRVILPMCYADEPICIVHFEVDKVQNHPSEEAVRKVQALLSSASGYVECLRLKSELDGWIVSMLETLIATIEAKDTYTHGHSHRVAKYCMAIAEQLKLDRETKRLLLASALCHDVGKIGIHDSILKKASMLNADEYEEMKLHPTIGADIIAHIPNAKKFISGVKHHHEKWDGTGYPDGLAGEEIPFFARIVCIADVFDAMISGRSYSGFIDEAQAIEKLSEERDLFDPEIWKAFVKAFESGLLSAKTTTKNNNVDEDLEEKGVGFDDLKPPKSET